MPVVLPLPLTPHTVTNVTREAHGLFLATLATGVVWRVSREELLTMDQGSAKLITLELRELRASKPCSVAETDEFLDDFVYHPPGECPPTPDGQDVVMEPPIFDIDALSDGKNRSADEDRNDPVLKDGSNILDLLGMVAPGDDDVVPDVYEQLLGEQALSSTSDDQSLSNNWNLADLFCDGGNEADLKETVTVCEKPSIAPFS